MHRTMIALGRDTARFATLLAGSARLSLRRCTDRRVLMSMVLIAATHAASAYEAFDNGLIRFGTGAQASVNANGNLQQPFYYDGSLSQWFQLTYGNYPLDNAIGIGGTGTNEWNNSGTIALNAPLTNQVLDVSGFTATSGSKGYGTIVSTGTVTVGGKALQMRNTYEVQSDKSFVKITTRITNTSGSAIANVRVWVGTRDDYVGYSDDPTKVRGNLADGVFTQISSAATRAAALKIYSGESGVLFYSTSPKAHTAINYCCSFSSAYNQDPATSQITQTDDGSYALFVRMDDLADGSSEEFTWYYAAGPVANLDNIVGEVAQGSSAVTVTASAGANGTISPASIDVTSGGTTAFTVTPASGYRVDVVQGCGGTLNGNTFTTGAITTACAVTATFAVNSYTVTAVAGTGGAIAPASASVDYNTTTSFSVTPAEGYGIASVQGCGGTLNGNTFTTGAVTQACTVNATFSLKTYTLTASAGTGGSIAPGNIVVNHGSAQAFTVTPDAGYSIASVAGCGGTLQGSAFTSGPATAACTVTASFVRNLYTVTATAGDGGNVDPANVQISFGGVATIGVTPAAGYAIASVAGCGGSLTGSTYTTGAIAAACSVNASFSIVTPSFEPARPPLIELNARQLFTELPAASRPHAHGFDGTPIEVTLVGEQTRFEPGEHTLTWRAVDSRGAAATVQQTLRIWPTVSFSPDMTLGGQAGNYDFFRIVLNGASPVYPFTVNYAVSGDASGTDLQSGTAIFSANERDKSVGFAVLATMPAGSASRQVQVALDEAVNRDSNRPLGIRLTATNEAPSVKLEVSQGGERRPSVSRDAGPVTIAADIRDPNTNDTHTLQWSGPSGAMFTSSGDTITIQPGSLAPGVHRFELTIADSGSPPLTTRSSFELVVLDTQRAAPGDAAGWLPSGLPNHPDYAPAAANVLPERARELTHHLMESEPGTQLALGAYSVLLGQYQTELPGTMTAGTLPNDAVANLGGYFDFVVSDLPRAATSVSVVIPQRAAIPAQPVYRKYDPKTARWVNFAEGADDRLASAPGENGFCPPPASESYRVGLNPGDWCVRLTIRDGGANDSDGQENGSVSDPGGVGALSNVVVTGEAKGGGGAFDLWIGCAALLLSLMRALRRSGVRAMFLALLATSSGAMAEDTSHWYGGAQVGQARDDVSASDLTTRLRQLGYDVTATIGDRTPAAWRVYGGYQWLAHLAIEAGHVDLGKVKTTFTGAVGDPAQFLADARDVHPRSAEGLDLSLVTRYDLGTRWSVQAHAGAFAWNSRVSTRIAGGAAAHRYDSGIDALLGIGCDLNLNRKWSLGATGTRYGIQGDHIDFVAAGLIYRWR